MVRHRRNHCRVFGEKVVSVGVWVSEPLGYNCGNSLGTGMLGHLSNYLLPAAIDISCSWDPNSGTVLELSSHLWLLAAPSRGE